MGDGDGGGKRQQGRVRATPARRGLRHEDGKRTGRARGAPPARGGAPLFFSPTGASPGGRRSVGEGSRDSTRSGSQGRQHDTRAGGDRRHTRAGSRTGSLTRAGSEREDPRPWRLPIGRGFEASRTEVRGKPCSSRTISRKAHERRAGPNCKRDGQEDRWLAPQASVRIRDHRRNGANGRPLTSRGGSRPKTERPNGGLRERMGLDLERAAVDLDQSSTAGRSALSDRPKHQKTAVQDSSRKGKTESRYEHSHAAARGRGMEGAKKRPAGGTRRRREQGKNHDETGRTPRRQAGKEERHTTRRSNRLESGMTEEDRSAKKRRAGNGTAERVRDGRRSTSAGGKSGRTKAGAGGRQEGASAKEERRHSTRKGSQAEHGKAETGPRTDQGPGSRTMASKTEERRNRTEPRAAERRSARQGNGESGPSSRQQSEGRHDRRGQKTDQAGASSGQEVDGQEHE